MISNEKRKLNFVNGDRLIYMIILIMVMTKNSQKMKMTFFGKFYTVAFYRILIVKKIHKWWLWEAYTILMNTKYDS